VGIPCGFELVADLEPARSRLGQLASANPGEYFVFDLTAKHVLVSLVSTDEEKNTAQCRIQELVSLWPGQFQVVDQQSHQIIARVNGLPNHGEPMVD